MDDVRVGSLVRAVRHRLGWTQAEVAVRAGVSQRHVSNLEAGRLENMTVRSARRIGSALEIRLPFSPTWRGGDGARLVDAGHAALIERIVGVLRAGTWECVVEFTFNVFGERGSVDVLGWHAATGTLLIAEAKTRLLDTQDTNASLARKARIVPRVSARERGWAARHVGVLLVLDDLTANRSAVARHSSTFEAAYPVRGHDVRAWIRHPVGNLRGVWFLAPSTGGATTRRGTARPRVRHAQPSSAAPTVLPSSTTNAGTETRPA